MNEQSPETEGNRQAGVINQRIENNYYIVGIRWKDGQESEMHFPVGGFPIIDPASRQTLTQIKAEQALALLRQHAAMLTRSEFSWDKLLSDSAG